jgi:hypothetical protein
MLELRELLDSTDQEKHDQYDHDDADDTAGRVSPVPAMWPSRNDAEKDQHQKDQQ